MALEDNGDYFAYQYSVFVQPCSHFHVLYPHSNTPAHPPPLNITCHLCYPTLHTITHGCAPLNSYVHFVTSKQNKSIIVRISKIPRAVVRGISLGGAVGGGGGGSFPCCYRSDKHRVRGKCTPGQCSSISCSTACGTATATVSPTRPPPPLPLITTAQRPRSKHHTPHTHPTSQR